MLKKTIENDRKKETEYASIWQFCLFGIESRFNRGYREKMRDYKIPSNPPGRGRGGEYWEKAKRKCTGSRIDHDPLHDYTSLPMQKVVKYHSY